MPKDFLSIRDLSLYEFNALMDLAQKIKEKPAKFRNRLSQIILAVISRAPDPRVRVSFEAGLLQLGGEAVHMNPDPAGLHSPENACDLGRSLERWVDGIVVCGLDHHTVSEVALSSSRPVINVLSSRFHPCQALADFFTLREKLGDLSKITVAYVGPGGNLCHSLILAAAQAGSRIQISAPQGYQPDPEIIKTAEEIGRENGFSIRLCDDPSETVSNAEAVYTEAWTSKAREDQTKERARISAPYQINKDIMRKAKPQAVFMHRLPAFRGEEVTKDTIDSDISLVFQQAENRLHIQKAIMLSLLETRIKNE